MTTTIRPTEWAAFFNHHAPVYEQNCFTRNTLAEVEFLMEVLALQPGMELLDLGCGTGRHSIELASRGLRITGVDVSGGMLEQARRNALARGIEVNWIQADARAFSLPEPVDAAVCLCEGSFGLLGSADDPIAQPRAILGSVAHALKPGAPCLFTVLNGYAMCRRRSQADVEQGRFDPLALAEQSDCEAIGGPAGLVLRERGFVPTELVLLFGLAGLEVEQQWGGTAGRWGRRAIDLDEMEIMVLARKR